MRTREVPSHVPAPDKDRDLVLYKYDACLYCARVRNAATRLEIGLRTRDVRQDPSAAAELRELTGRTQVPCLVIDGAPLLESSDIVAWLEAYAARGEEGAS